MIQRVRKVGLLIALVFMGHIFLPLTFILQLRRPAENDMLVWVLSFYAAASYIALVYFAGAWSWFGKWVRYGLPALLLVTAGTTFPHDYAEVGISSLAAIEPVISLCVGAVFTVALVLAFRGRKLSGQAIELDFPFRGGTYYVAQGGSNRMVNMHSVSPSQRFALDILKLNAIGVRAWGLYPADPKRYAIFGAEVVSPCDGVVAAAEDGFPDLSPPERDPDHRAGNFVALESDGATIYMAHLMKESVSVKTGDRVHAGQVLGRVGNSGNTTEPHLHIHAEEGAYPGHFSGKRGVPMRFNGRFLVRNDCVKVESEK